jgi:hypothetical protein
MLATRYYRRIADGRQTRIFSCVAVATMLAILPPAAGAGQEAPTAQLPPGMDIKVQAQPLKATVGDPIRIDFDITLPEGFRLMFPALPGQLGEFTVLESFPGPLVPSDKPEEDKQPASKSPGAQIPGMDHHRARIVAAVYRTGEFEFPALPLRLTDKAGAPREVRTPAVSIRIESVLDEKDLNLRDLKKQAEIEEPRRWLLWFAILAAALVLLTVVWRMMRRRNPAVLPPALPEVDPLDQAEADLRDLLGANLLEKGMVKHFYVRVSEIVKRGLEAGYGIQTIEKTTSEIMAALARPPESGTAVPEPSRMELVETLLLSCDMVKFARYLPPRPESEGVTAMALQVLADCRERRQPVASGEVPVAGAS